MDTNKLSVVYFHGYGSSSTSDKVTGLAEHFIVHAPSIPIKFDEAKKILINFINELNLNLSNEVVFVGTSLGGYWAGLMGEIFMVPTIMINPSCNPSKTLRLYNNPELSEEELCKYSDLHLRLTFGVPRVILLAEDDEVLDYTIAANCIYGEKVYFKNGGHRFNEIGIISKYITYIAENSFYLP